MAKAAEDCCNFYLQRLKECFSASMIDMRRSVVAPRTVSPDGANGLADLLNEFEIKTKNSVKEVQAELQV